MDFPIDFGERSLPGRTKARDLKALLDMPYSHHVADGEYEAFNKNGSLGVRVEDVAQGVSVLAGYRDAYTGQQIDTPDGPANELARIYSIGSLTQDFTKPRRQQVAEFALSGVLGAGRMWHVAPRYFDNSYIWLSEPVPAQYKDDGSSITRAFRVAVSGNGTFSEVAKLWGTRFNIRSEATSTGARWSIAAPHTAVTDGAYHGGEYRCGIARSIWYADGSSAVLFSEFSATSLRGQYTIIDDARPVFPIALQRLGPSSYLCVIGRWVRRPDPGNDPDESVEFHHSTDGGQTWTKLTGALISALNTYITEVPSTTTWFGDGPARLIVKAVPINANEAVLVLGWTHTDGTHRSQVRAWAMSGGSFVEIDTLHDGTENLIVPFRLMEFGLIPALGGAVLALNPDAATNGSTAPLIVAKSTGGMFLQQTTTPWAVANCGRPRALDPATLVMPAFDGEYRTRTYSAADGWKSWSKVSNATSLVVGSSPETEPYVIAECQEILPLLKAGAAYSPTPGAPWISDERITPP